MLSHRIELESPESHETRYFEALRGWQRTYEFFWELSGAFGKRLFGGLAEESLQELRKVADQGIGRKRFLRIGGPFRIPITQTAPQL